MTIPTLHRCPNCGGVLEVDTACKIVEPEEYATGQDDRNKPTPRRLKTRRAPAALCTGCEFCMEIVTVKESGS